MIRYSGFWQRVGAYLIDLLVVAPLGALDFFIGGSSHLYPLYIFIPGQCLGLFLHVWMVRKYGGTPGKLVLGLRISMSDGAAVTLLKDLVALCGHVGAGPELVACADHGRDENLGRELCRPELPPAQPGTGRQRTGLVHGRDRGVADLGGGLPDHHAGQQGAPLPA
ncbi:RDD family protein [Massilia sp. H-1]|nr:RDD family protein [Massilia sp. H-1]